MKNNPSTQDKVFAPWDAHIARTKIVSIDEANGQLAASTIRQYPPGIPDVIPGMRYTEETVARLNSAAAAGVDLIGMENGSARLVEVACDDIKRTNSLSIRTFDSDKINAGRADEIADFFRAQFSVSPYYHFAFHESDPLQSLPQNLDFAAYAVSTALSDDKKRRACQETLRDMAFRETLGSKPSLNSGASILPKGFHHWTDQVICRDKIRDRLSDPGYVTLIRDKNSGQLEGLLHSRLGTIERLFHSEEWCNPHIFSAFSDAAFHASPEDFYNKIEYHFGLKPTDPVMTISAQILTPAAQGGEVFYDMMRSMAERIIPAHTRLPLLCEIPRYGTAHTLNRAFTDRIVFGVLKNTHPLVFCKQTSQALFPFISEKSHWQSALRAAVQDSRHYRSKYYVPLSTDHNAVEVRPNGQLGLAVFATEDIPSGATIAVFTGERYKSETALGLPEIMRDHAIQVGKQDYVFGHKGLAHRLCHSCDPNCGIRNLTEIFAVREIAAGEQITWDYRCSENSDWVLEECLCGAERCTGSVKNHDSLPQDIKAEYVAKGMVSEWIKA